MELGRLDVWLFVWAIFAAASCRFEADSTGLETVRLSGGIVLVASLNGVLTALNVQTGNILWQHNFRQSFFQSSMTNLDIVRDGVNIKIVPSLNGRIFSLGGDNIELMPFDVNDILEQAHRLAPGMFVTGKKESSVYCMDLFTGRLRLACHPDSGCYHGDANETGTNNVAGDGVDDSSLVDDPTLEVNLRFQKVRAIHKLTGEERWNFSVGEPELVLVNGTLGGRQSPVGLATFLDDSPSGVDDGPWKCLSFLRSAGIVQSTSWKFDVRSPIVAVWGIGARADVGRPSDNGSSSIAHLELTKLPLDTEQSIFLNSFGGQMYIQISDDLNSHSLEQLMRHEWEARPAYVPAIADQSMSGQRNLYGNGDRFASIEDLLAQHDNHNSLASYGSGGGGDDRFDRSKVLSSIDGALTLFSRKCFHHQSHPNHPLYDQLVVVDGLHSLFSYQWYLFLTAIVVIVASPMWWKLSRHGMTRLTRSSSSTSSIGTTASFYLEQEPHELGGNEDADDGPYQRRRIRKDTRDASTSADNEEFANQGPSRQVTVTANLSGSSATGSSSNGSALLRPALSFVSRYLEDFVQECRLGSGGYGVVYKARNKLDDRYYAVKRIPLKDSVMREKVLREVKALASLEHQNIVRYYNSWVETPPAEFSYPRDERSPADTTTSLDTSNVLSSEPLSSGDALSEPVDLSSYQPDDASNCLLPPLLTPRPSGAMRSISSDTEDSDIVFGGDTDKEQTASKQSSQQSSQPAAAVAVQTNTESSRPSEQPFQRTTPKDRLRSYLYIQMQLCLSQSLREWLLQTGSDSGPLVSDCSSCEPAVTLPERTRKVELDIFRQILSAVCYIHEKGCVHRDLKPSNIFFAPDGSVKIGDFGLAVLGNETGSMVNSTLPPVDGRLIERQHTDGVGTRLYMSPEQSNPAGSYTEKVDIFSVGLILFELLYRMSTRMERNGVLAGVRDGRFPVDFERNNVQFMQLIRQLLDKTASARPTAQEVLRMPLIVSES